MLPSLPVLEAGPLQFMQEAPQEGGQALVYHAVLSNRPVAVKIAGNGGDAARAVREEGRALLAIHSRDSSAREWLVQLIDAGETKDGRPFLVLPWYRWSLSSWLQEARPGLLRRLQALEGAAAAVVRLHNSGASLSAIPVHRDLKPGNFLVSDDGGNPHVVLADLGGIKERSLIESTRHTGLYTPHFAPVEQTLPLHSRQDPSADIHALAVTIYAVLTGRAPQSTILRSGALSDEAHELVRLARATGHRTEAEEKRLQELQAWPIARFLDVDHAPPLFPSDIERLRNACEQLSEGEMEKPKAASSAICERLAGPMQRALDIDPVRRPESARELLAALEHARRAAEQAQLPWPAPALGSVSAESPTQPSIQPGLSDEDPGPRSRGPRRWLPVALLTAVLTLAVGGSAAVWGLSQWSALQLTHAAPPLQPASITSEMRSGEPIDPPSISPPAHVTEPGSQPPEGPLAEEDAVDLDTPDHTTDAHRPAPTPSQPETKPPAPAPASVTLFTRFDFGATLSSAGRTTTGELQVPLRSTASTTVTVEKGDGTARYSYRLSWAPSTAESWVLQVSSPGGKPHHFIIPAGTAPVLTFIQPDQLRLE